MDYEIFDTDILNIYIEYTIILYIYTFLIFSNKIFYLKIYKIYKIYLYKHIII